MHLGWYMTLHGRYDVELIVKPLWRKRHLWTGTSTSTGSRHPEQPVNFFLDPSGHTVGRRVHWGDDLISESSLTVKRKYVVYNKRDQRSKRQRKVSILAAEGNELGKASKIPLEYSWYNEDVPTISGGFYP